MATVSNSNRRYSSKELKKCIEIYEAILGMPDYKPLNPELTIEVLTKQYNEMISNQTKESKLDRELTSQKDKTQTSESTFYASVQDSKQQVIAQYGAESVEVELVGLKKKSSRKRRTPSIKAKTA